MAEDLLDTIGQLFGPVRGGLAYAVIFVGALLAATTGVVAASVISMGLISLPIMLRYGYDRRFAIGRDRRVGHAGADHPAVAGADHHGRPARPVGRRHVRRRLHSRHHAGRPVRASMCSASHRQAGLGAGAAAGSAHVARARRRGRHALAAGADDRRRRVGGRVRALEVRRPTIRPTRCWSWRPASARASRSLPRSLNRVFKLGLLSRIAERVTFVLIPPLALIFLVLGTIFLGVATPTEGGAMGATGALIMALARRRLSLAAAAAGDGHDGEAVDLRRLHPGRRARVQPDLLRRQRPRLGRAPADAACPAASSAS